MSHTEMIYSHTEDVKGNRTTIHSMQRLHHNKAETITQGYEKSELLRRYAHIGHGKKYLRHHATDQGWLWLLRGCNGIQWATVLVAPKIVKV